MLFAIDDAPPDLNAALAADHRRDQLNVIVGQEHVPGDFKPKPIHRVL